MTASPTRRRARMRLTSRRAGALAAAVAAVLVATPMVSVASPAPARVAEITAGESAAVPDPEAEPADRADLGLVPVSEPAAPAIEPDRVLVRFAPGTSASAKRGSIEAADGTQDGAIGGTGFVAVETAPGEAADVAAELDADPSVADVQVDHVRASSGVEVWGGEEYLEHAWPYLELTTLPSAWESADGRGVTIAVLDTAIYTTHLELASRIVPGIDLVGGWMTNSHGTAVASVAAGGANGLGAVGAAYAASVMPVRVLDDSGQGTDSTIAAGIDWASSHGAKVINLSLGGPDPSLVLRAAMQTAVSRGSVVVVAAGNSGNDVPQYPAAYAAELPGVLSVASTNDDGETLPSSSGGDSVSLAAPGLDIIGAGANGTPWVSMSGTSVAAPFVSGAAALVIQKNPTWTPAQVSERLMTTSRDAGPRGVDPYFGRGILDAGAALGQTPAVPLDRAVGDAGATDDLPNRAIAVSVPSTTPLDLYTQGDVDWRMFTGVAGTDYEIALRGLGATPSSVTVLDANGRELTAEDETLLGRTSTYRSSHDGPIYVGAEHLGSLGYLRVGVAPVQRPAGFAAFGNPQSISTAPRLYSYDPVVADVTGDGIDDVVSETYPKNGSSTLVLSPGLPTGVVNPEVTLSVPGGESYKGFVVTNLSGDAVPEIVVVGAEHVYRTSARNGTWAPLETVSTALQNVGRAAAGDLDDDGDQDVALASAWGAVIFRNVAGQLQQEGPNTASNTGSNALGIVDLDGVNGLDLLMDHGETAMQQPDGTFVAGPTIPGLDSNYLVRVLPLDGDGIPDVILNPRALGFDVLHGKVGGGLTAPVYVPMNGFDMTVADLNGDGRTDLVGALQTALQAADGSYFVSQLKGCARPADVKDLWTIARELTGDGRPDILCANSTGTSVVPQLDLTVPGAPEWVWGVTPEAFATGVAARPDVVVTSRRALASSSGVTLVGSDGKAVVASAVLDPTGHEITLHPSADLVTGGHYEVLVTGLEDTDGDVMSHTVRSWFTVGASGQRYTPVDPVRWLDTREGAGALEPGSPLDLSFEELPDDATAVVLNVTAAAPVGAGFVRVFPTPADGVTTEPTTSSLNLANGIDQPNLVTVKLGRDRSVRISSIWTTTHIVVDLAGYYGAGGATAYVPLAPVRVMDNRTGEDGSFKGRISAGTYVDLQVAGKNGVPADASAVVLNVTGVNPPGRTTVRVYPTPEPFRNSWRPEVSNLNLMPGRDQPNLVTVKVGWNGKVRFYVHNTDMFLVADLAGYYSPTGANGFTAMDPVRLADTRTGLGLPGGRMVPTESRTLRVSGTHGIPADAKAAVLNVTGARPGYLTVIRVFPAGLAQLPSISNLNLVPGRDDPNMVISKIGTGGGVDFYTHSATTDLVVDVGGYFTTFR